MLESIKRFFSPKPEGPDFGQVAEWASRRGMGFKRARGEAGFVIDGMLEDKPWRIEWGPPQRPYIHGHELRLRMSLPMPSEMQMLLLSRPLMDTLERQTFEEFTDSVQTQIGTKTPEEMRWLVMFPKVDMSTLKTLRTRFGAVASTPSLGLAWLEGSLADALEEAAVGVLRDGPPFVLMTLRGRAYLRMQLVEPDVTAIAAALALFEIAVTQALTASEGVAERPSDWNTTAASAWQSLQPDGGDDPHHPRRRR